MVYVGQKYKKDPGWVLHMTFGWKPGLYSPVSGQLGLVTRTSGARPPDTSQWIVKKVSETYILS